jgi:superfamily II DNA helicase RecQ
MQMRFFSIPLHDGEQAAEELNGFLAAHKVLSVERHFVQDGANSSWAVCVSYLQGNGRPPSAKKSKIDYREVLSEEDFAVFAKLRSLRKTLAEKDGVPAYALFTNEQLAEMVRRRVHTNSGLKEIEGIGQARVDKYGASFITILREGRMHSSEESALPNSVDKS